MTVFAHTAPYPASPSELQDRTERMFARQAALGSGHAFVSCGADIDVAFVSPEQNPADLMHALLASGQVQQVVATTDMGQVGVPSSYRAAMNSEHASYWIAAIEKELQGLVSLNVWELVPAADMPSGANLMNCHFVFAVKRNSDGSIEKFKARLVADGNTQKYGVDFDRIFATVVKASTIRLALVLAAANDYNLSSIDIRQAYLHAHLKEYLYMRVPPGISAFDDRRRPLVCRLRRSLYGLKQAGREWGELFAKFLTDWGLSRSTVDTCLYVFRKGGELLWVLVYVDDALIVDNSAQLRKRFVDDLSKRFPTEDKGDLEWILNIHITRDRPQRSLSMSQELYVKDLLAKHAHALDVTSTRRFDSPLEEGTLLTDEDQPAVGSPAHNDMLEVRASYMKIVGGLLWLSTMTRPDIAYATTQLSRFLTNPGPSHYKAAIRVLIYLRGTPDRCLVFKPNRLMPFETYVDSSWESKFSCSGAMLFVRGCLFMWFVKTQRSVSLSSAEAEYFGAMLAAREVIFHRELFVDLMFALDGPTIIFTDSKSAIDMSYDPVAFKKTKHILRAAQFLRDLVAREVVLLRHVPGRVMLADLLTKAVARAIFTHLLTLLNEYSVKRLAYVPATATEAPATATEALAAPLPVGLWRAAMDTEVQGKFPAASPSLPPVPDDELQAALDRRARGCALPTDEVVLSHAVSRGVAPRSASDPEK